MFLLRNLPKHNRQKTRVSNVTTLVANPSHAGFDMQNSQLSALSHIGSFSFFVVAVSGGFLHPKCVNYLYTYSKKVLKLSKHTTRLWVNVPATRVITRKALNVRMGKGKGGRYGINCAVRAATTLVAVQGSRPGVLQRIYRFMRARSSFVVTTFWAPKLMQRSHPQFASTFRKHATPQKFAQFTRGTYRNNYKVTARRKIWTNLLETYMLLKRVQRLKLMKYLYRSFSYYRTTTRHLYISDFYEIFMSVLNLRLSLYFVRSYSEYSLIILLMQLPDFYYGLDDLVHPCLTHDVDPSQSI